MVWTGKQKTNKGSSNVAKWRPWHYGMVEYYNRRPWHGRFCKVIRGSHFSYGNMVFLAEMAEE
jgi:hypothetical protein